MNSITIYGASDDLIEVEGDLSEEFGCYDEKENYLSFNDGTVLSVVYADDGCWRINRVVKGTAEYSKVEADGADTDNYTDRVTLKGNITSVVYGTKIAKAAVAK